MNKEIIDLLEKKKVKPTAVRILVLDVFFQYDFAISLPEIENKLPWSDRVSIYRTLKTFENADLIHQVNDGSKSAKYALCSEHCEFDNHSVHPHFHCTKCDKTVCLDEQSIDIKNIPFGFIAKDYSLIINGLCDKCK